MTLRTILTATAISAATLIAAPAFAGDSAEMKAGVTYDRTSVETPDPAAKAPLQQQKAEDLYQRAEQQYDAGLENTAKQTVVEGIKMEIKAETNVQKAQAMTGEALRLETSGETVDPLLGENATALVKADATRTIIVPQTTTLSTERETITTVTCPEGTKIQSDNTCLITGEYQM